MQSYKRRKKCSSKTCCKFRFNHFLKFWKKIGSSCKRETTCTDKRKSCKWQNIGNRCFRRSCCSTVFLNEKAVVGSTKCTKGRVKCNPERKRTCKWNEGKK